MESELTRSEQHASRTAEVAPSMAGDVSIARFFSNDNPDKWRVTVDQTHFLTDRFTARRIASLVTETPGHVTYAQAYQRYCDIEDQPEPIDAFIEWFENRRQRLEALGTSTQELPVRYRVQLLSAALCERIGATLGKLFSRVAVLFVAAPTSIFIALQLAADKQTVPGNFWTALVLAMSGILVHELGHIAACVRYGAKQGGIGIGLYWIWPAFYADVRGSWALAPVQRALVSSGGLYFQSLYMGALCGANLFLHSATVTMAISITALLMATTLNPIWKFDGYWILSDVLNLQNVHARIRAHLRSLIRSEDRMASSALLSKMTVLSVGFAVAAGAYMVYMLDVLAHLCLQQAMRFALLCEQLRAMHGFSLASPQGVIQIVQCLAAALAFLLPLAAVWVLFNRSVRNAWSICSQE